MKNLGIRFRLWVLGEFYIPLLGYTRPKIIQLDEEFAKIRIKLRFRTKNHLKSMYFGALAIGADTAAGIHVMHFAQKEKVKFSFAFKKAEMEFLKRAETHVTFVCKEGAKIKGIVQQAIQSKERINEPVVVEAFDTHGTVVARFIMTLSFKVK